MVNLSVRFQNSRQASYIFPVMEYDTLGRPEDNFVIIFLLQDYL